LRKRQLRSEAVIAVCALHVGNGQKRSSSRSLVRPGYMAMGKDGMADMGSMRMPLPDNTLPMMSGSGQFGPIEMGGMFTVVKVREGLARDDYKDPGWFKHPPGTVAYEWTGEAPQAPRASREGGNDKGDTKLKAVKPDGHGGHHH
jgi:manganese oxidase